jgi:hypothetical protein
MRAILLILIVAVVALIAALGLGLISINQTRPAEAPDIEASGEGISARGGQTPTFDVETGSISVRAREENVTVPVPAVDVTPANQAQPAENK